MEIIRVNGLCKTYGDIKALKKVNLSVNEGELYGLLGVNGAGKTTLIKILSGLTKATGGEAYVKDYDLSQIDRIKGIIDVSPQETAIAQNLTVKENLLFFQRLYGINDKEHLEKIIESFSLEEVLNRKARGKEFSIVVVAEGAKPIGGDITVKAVRNKGKGVDNKYRKHKGDMYIVLNVINKLR